MPVLRTRLLQARPLWTAQLQACTSSTGTDPPGPRKPQTPCRS
jgi:hypothetical protein